MDKKAFTVQVKPGAKEERVEEKEGVIKVWTKSPAKEGKANKAVQRLIAEYFSLSKSQVEIKRGLRSRHKTVYIHK